MIQKFDGILFLNPSKIIEKRVINIFILFQLPFIMKEVIGKGVGIC